MWRHNRTYLYKGVRAKGAIMSQELIALGLMDISRAEIVLKGIYIGHGHFLTCLVLDLPDEEVADY